LGQIISKHGLEVDPDKVQAVRDFPVSRNTTEVRAFHGLCNYFRRFIPKFGETSKALTDLYKKTTLRFVGQTFNSLPLTISKTLFALLKF
jgi:hypothetical protein